MVLLGFTSKPIWGFTLPPKIRSKNLKGCLSGRGSVSDGPYFGNILVGGFTMIEMVITIAIITVMSVVVLANFSGFGENVSMQRSAQELALDLRRAQNMSLSVRQVETEVGPIVPPAIGIYFGISTPDRYFLFADLDHNKRYDPSRDARVEREVVFEKSVKINSLLDQSSVSQSVVNVVFSAPEAAVSIFDNNNSIGEQLLIKLVSGTGRQEKSIRLRTSGQISIE